MKYVGLLTLATLVGLPALAQTTTAASQPQAAAAKPKEAQGRNRSGIYIQGGIESLLIDEEPFFYNPAFGAIQVRAGYAITPWIAVEAQGSLGIFAEEFDDDGEVYEADDIDLTNQLAVFVVPRVPIGPNFGIYGRLGFTSIEYEYDSGLKTTGQGPAIGIGADFDIGKASIAVDLTFTDFENKDHLGPSSSAKYDAAGISFAILGGYHF